MKPVFSDDTYHNALQAILNDTMTDAEFERRMKSPLFRLWIKHMVKEAHKDGTKGTDGNRGAL
jgi:flagellar biosynthesis protein FliP